MATQVPPPPGGFAFEPDPNISRRVLTARYLTHPFDTALTLQPLTLLLALELHRFTFACP